MQGVLVSLFKGSYGEENARQISLNNLGSIVFDSVSNKIFVGGVGYGGSGSGSSSNEVWITTEDYQALESIDPNTTYHIYNSSNSNYFDGNDN